MSYIEWCELLTQTTLTNTAGFGSLTIPHVVHHERHLVGAWLVLESTNAILGGMAVRLPRGTAAAGPGLIYLGEKWLRAHAPNVSTVDTAYRLIDTLEWRGDILLERNDVPADALLEGHVMQVSGATVGWSLYAQVEYRKVP